MRDLNELDAFRVSLGSSEHGAFALRSPTDAGELLVLASNGLGWDHVSVSRRDRIPNWTEMDAVARLFFRDDETAMQLHVPAVDHKNVHPRCLHLWRPQRKAIPRPPAIMV